MSWKFSVLNYFLGSTPEDEAPEEGASFTFMVPKKEISMVPDMGKWKRSQVGSSLWACARVFFESCLSYWTWYNHRLWRKSVAVSRFWRLSAVTWWNWWQRWCCRGHSTRNRLLIVLDATRLPLLPVICEEDVICNKLVSKYSVIFQFWSPLWLLCQHWGRKHSPLRQNLHMSSDIGGEDLKIGSKGFFPECLKRSPPHEKYRQLWQSASNQIHHQVVSLIKSDKEHMFFSPMTWLLVGGPTDWL